MEKKISQISDVHFGAEDFSYELKNNLYEQVLEENPDLIIVAGDLTTNGYPEEFQEVSEYIDDLNDIAEVHVIPGNHDARNEGLIHFENFIGPRRFKHVDVEGGFVIFGLDSSEPDINDGQIGLDQMSWLKKQLISVSDHLCKIVTFHHHLLPIPRSGRERNILSDSGDLLSVLIDCGVDFVLNGHKHVPNIWLIEELVVINSGTATTRKLRGFGFPSHNQIVINEDLVTVNLVSTDTGVKKRIARYSTKIKDDDFGISGYKHYLNRNMV